MPAEYTGRDEGHSNSVTREYSVASGVTLTDGDFVYLAAGRVTNAAIAGKRLLGTVIGGDTQNLDRSYGLTAVGNAGGTVKVLVNIERDARYLVKCSGAMVEATHLGKQFGLTGNTGAQQVDLTTVTDSTGQVVCIQTNPGIRGTDNTFGLFRMAAKQVDADALV
jgi:hypothetical protein